MWSTAFDLGLCVPGREADEIEQKINHDLSSLNDWLIANKLNLNIVKSELMMIADTHHWPKTNPLYRWILLSACTKHLRVEIDSRLSWSNHIDKICKKVSSGIGIIKRARPFVNSNILPGYIVTL